MKKIIYDYFSFEGRIGRKTYALRLLTLFVLFCGAIIGVFGLNTKGATEGLPFFIAFVMIMISFISLHVRRSFDRGRSAWGIIFDIVSVLGFVVAVLVNLVAPGHIGENKYGLPPKRKIVTKKKNVGGRFDRG